MKFQLYPRSWPLPVRAQDATHAAFALGTAVVRTAGPSALLWAGNVSDFPDAGNYAAGDFPVDAGELSASCHGPGIGRAQLLAKQDTL